MEKKLIIIINGGSGVGKSTLIKIAAGELMVRNVSSVSHVKEVAVCAGWNGVKDLPGRQLLTDLKQAMVTYDNSPYKAMVQELNIFMSGGEQVMFAHIHEPEEIKKFAQAVKDKGGKVVTLFVTRTTTGELDLAQKEELAKSYDHVFANDKPIKESGPEFVKWLKEQIG